MGTTSTAGAAGTTPTGTTGTLYFTGLSTFSSDFQSIIQRAVQVAQVPVTNLQNQETLNTNKKAALVALNPGVAAVGADVAALGTIASNQGLAASSSDSTTVSVVNTGATAPATYTVSDISKLAAAASETSLAGYTASQAVSASGVVNLVLGSTTYQIDLTSSENTVSGLAQAINNLNAGVSANVLTTPSNDYLTLSASQTGATTLQLNDVTPTDLVTNNGTGTETSLQTYTDTTTAPVSSTGQVQLVVGTQTFALDVSANNNLNGLVQAINNANAGVTATVTGSAGAYSLSVSATGGPTTIQVNDLQNPTDLISATNQGSNADFFLNGIEVIRPTNTVNDIVPGLSFTLLNTTSGSVTLSLATDPSQLSTALQTFVNDYNTLVTEVSQQQGQGAGPLGGDLTISEISDDMQQLATYWDPSSTSSVRSLSDLGVTFNDTGQMSFDADTFNALSPSQITDAFAFLGSANSGFGALANSFTQLSDPITGLIQTEENGLDQSNTEIESQITTAQARVAQVQQAATAQAEAADALVAQLQQEQTDLDASIQSVNYALYGRQVGANGI